MESSNTDDVPPGRASSVWQFVATGALGFGAASLCVFATVAFAEGWMYANLGIAGAYVVWTLLFVLLGGIALHPLVRGANRGWRFVALFGLAFLAYSAGWVTAYFLQKNLIGEWIGSAAGSGLLALTFAIGFRTLSATPRFIAILFLTNSAGYFLGSMVNNALGKQWGMISWGGIYGLFLGAGLGAVLYLVTRFPVRRGPDNE